MKHEQVAQQLLMRLRINEKAPEYSTLKEMAVLILEAECNEREITELPDSELYEFINKTKSNDLYRRYIEETQRKMLIARITNPDMVLPRGGTIVFDGAIENLSYYLERMAAILWSDNLDHFQEDDFKRLGIEDIALVKKLIEFCPLIEKRDNQYFFKKKWLMSYLCAAEDYRFAQNCGFTIDENSEQYKLGIRRGADGKAYYPLPQRKPRPWDLPTVTPQKPATSENSGSSSLGTQISSEAIYSNGVSNQDSPTIAPQDRISKAEFERILNTYKSQSLLGYLSTFWIFSWISPTRSQTIRELKSLLSVVQGEEVNRNQIEDALNRGDNNTHRLGLFKEKLEHAKNGTGTDEVIVQLSDAFKNKP